MSITNVVNIVIMKHVNQFYVSNPLTPRDVSIKVDRIKHIARHVVNNPFGLISSKSFCSRLGHVWYECSILPRGRNTELAILA
jgi:hypothetical protein